jgi:hypothetical protein
MPYNFLSPEWGTHTPIKRNSSRPKGKTLSQADAGMGI